MQKAKNSLKNLFLFSVLFLFSTAICSYTIAQQVFGVSFGYEHFPSVELVDPIIEASGLEIQTSSMRAGAAFPLVFGKGKIIIMNQISYKRTNLDYKNLPNDDTEIDQIQEYQYTIFMI